MTDPALVEAIVRAVLAQLRAEEPPCACHAAAGGLLPRPPRPPAGPRAPSASACRRPRTLYPREIARLIDHTLLKPDATREQIETLCARGARARLRHASA